MNALDRAIAAVAPGWGAQRMRSRAMVQAYYEAAKASRTRTLRKNTGSADRTTKTAGPVLREIARDLERNHDLARCALDVLVTNIVGMGLRPEPQVRLLSGEPATGLNDLLGELWEDWIQRPDVTGELHYYAAQRLLCRTWLRDGEGLVQHVEGASAPIHHQTRVPYSIELVESDYCPHDLEDPARGINQGIKRNQWGRPLGFYLHRQHPGDAGYMAAIKTDYRYIPAERMDHLKLVDRIRQARGVTVFAPVLGRLDDIKEIEESERVAARIAAAMAVYIKKGLPEMYAGGADAAPREMDFAPGMVFDDLGPGEDVGTISNNRPNNQVVQFVDAMLRRVAGGARVSYSSVSKNYNGTYSAQRQELVEQYGVYGVLWSDFSEGHVRPTWQRFVRAAQAAGLLDGADGVDMATLYDADISRPAMPWIDPAKEAKANSTLLELELESESHIIRQRGRNPAQVRQQIAEDKARKAAADSASDKPEQGGGDQPESDPSTELKTAVDAYGSAVRAGAVTPQMDDEQHFRDVAGLPAMSDEVAEAWENDGGTRRPITLQSGDAFEASQADLADSDDPPPEEPEQPDEEKPAK